MKEAIDEAHLTWEGKVFQRVGPAIEKQRSPYDFVCSRVLGIYSVMCVSDLRPRLGFMDRREHK